MFAPGLAGYGVITNLSRVMFALGRLKVAALAFGGSWVLVIVADIVLTLLVPAHLVVAALALGTTIGQTLVAIPLVMATRRIRGHAAVQGVRRAALSGLVAAAIGAAVGLAVSIAVPVDRKLVAIGVALLAACCATISFGVVAFILDNGDLRAFLARLRRTSRVRA